ncbi:MAG TPA: hypothetical protein VHH36_06980 [Candidatus Thermoplasmatota archaeon]|nr:hypothetical protein [Candidatus Thermoplasmatota archaeon]
MAKDAERRWERAAGVASLGAASVHGGLAPAHFDAWWGYGAFFLLAAAAQAVLGLALLVDPFDPARLRIPVERARRRMRVAGALGQAALVALYAVSRVRGVPFAGPARGVVEPVAPLDLVAKALEVACAAILAVLLLREPFSSALRLRGA